MEYQIKLEEQQRKSFMDLSLSDTIYQVMLLPLQASVLLVNLFFFCAQQDEEANTRMRAALCP